MTDNRHCAADLYIGILHSVALGMAWEYLGLAQVVYPGSNCWELHGTRPPIMARNRARDVDSRPQPLGPLPSDQKCPEAGVYKFIFKDAPDLFQNKLLDLANILQNLLSVLSLADLTLDLDFL